jgi:hypothetical protein
MAVWDLEADYEDALGDLGAVIARALFGAEPNTTLHFGDTRVELSEEEANALVRALARCSLAPSPRLPKQPDPREGLAGDWSQSSLEADPLPPDLLDTADDHLGVLAQVSRHIEQLQALAQTHLSDKSRASVDRALTHVWKTFRDCVPADDLLIGRRGTNQRGEWIRDAGAILRDTIEATGAPAPSTDDLGQLVANLLDALTPDQEPPTDPSSVARLLRHRSRSASSD